MTNCPEIFQALHHPQCPGHEGILAYEVHFQDDGSLRFDTEAEAEYPLILCGRYARALKAAAVRAKSIPASLTSASRLGCIVMELKESTARLMDPAVADQVARKVLEVELEMQPGQETAHLQAMVRRVSHLCTGKVYQAGAQLTPYPAYGWLWNEILAFRWKRSQHINILYPTYEVTAFLSYLRHRARSSSSQSSRWLHILDSLDSTNLIAKGRSSSKRLNMLCRRIMAVCLTSDLYPLVLWTVSRWNFAYHASRRRGSASDE